MPQGAHWQKSLPFAGDGAAQPAALATINFEPSDDVHYLHGFLHPGSGGADFDPSALSSQGNDDYLRTLAALGGVAMGVFFMFILIFVCILIARRGTWRDKSCSQCALGCNFPILSGNMNFNVGLYRIRSRGTRPLQFIVMVGLFVTLLGAWRTVRTHNQLRSDISSINTSSVALDRAFQKVLADTGALATDTQDLSRDATRAACPASPSAVSTNVGQLHDAAIKARSIAGDAIAPVPILGPGGPVDGAASGIETLLGIVPSALCAVCLVGIAGVTASSNRVVGMASGLGVLVLSAAAVTVSVVMFTSVGVADFCMMPDVHTVESLQAMGMQTRAALARHFIHCDGALSNPLEQQLQVATSHAKVLLKSANTCTDAAYRQTFVESVEAAEEAIDKLRQDVRCPEVRKIYQDAVYRDTCGELVSHLLSAWQTLTIASATLLMALTFASFVDLEGTEEPLDMDTPTQRARRRRRMKAEVRRRKNRIVKASAVAATADDDLYSDRVRSPDQEEDDDGPSDDDENDRLLGTWGEAGGAPV